MDPEPAFAYSYSYYSPVSDEVREMELPEPKTITQFCYMLSKLNHDCRLYGVIYFSTPESFIPTNNKLKARN